MAEPAPASTLRRALVAHEPEVLPLSAIFKNAWRVFKNHARLLLTVSILTAAIPLLVVLALTAIFGPVVQPPSGGSGSLPPWGPHGLQKHHGGYSPAPAPHGGYSPAPGPSPPEPKVNPITLAISTILNFLLSSGAHVALVAVVVYIVLGDYAGRTIENSFTVVKRSFWRLLGTDVAQSLVTLLLTILLSGIVGVVGGVISGIFLRGSNPQVPASVAAVLWVIFALPTIIFVAINLSVADQASAAEGSGVWGWAALKRSWALTKGSRRSILAVILLSALVSILLGSPIEVLVSTFQEGTTVVKDWWQILLTIALAVLVFLLSASIQAYLQVVWVVLYLSSRKKVEPEFGLGHFDRYFQEEANRAPGGYTQARAWDP